MGRNSDVRITKPVLARSAEEAAYLHDMVEAVFENINPLLELADEPPSMGDLETFEIMKKCMCWMLGHPGGQPIQTLIDGLTIDLASLGIELRPYGDKSEA